MKYFAGQPEIAGEWRKSKMADLMNLEPDRPGLTTARLQDRKLRSVTTNRNASWR